MSKLSHLDESGQAHMVSVTDKEATQRRAVASARVRTRPEVIRLIAEGRMQKGDVLAVARVAGIMGAKRTADLVPLCHPLPLEAVAVDLTLGEDVVEIRTSVTTTAKTGVEMEALTAAMAAALTLYDMCKAVDRAMTIETVRLEEKTGGRSGAFVREKE